MPRIVRKGVECVDMSKFIAWFRCLLLLGLCAYASSWSAQHVKVGGYPYPPFVDGQAGVTFDVLEAMNKVQNKYVFEFVETSANRRYQHMAENKFSVMVFESIAWGWDAHSVDASNVFLSGDGEVFVAKTAAGRNQEYFDNLRDKRLVGTLGYHYAFAGYSANLEALKKNFQIILVPDVKQALPIVLQDVADIAIVSKSYLQGFLMTNQKDAMRLLVSERMDQVYKHTVLVKKGTKPSVDEVNQLLKKLESTGQLKKIWNKYGIGK